VAERKFLGDKVLLSILRNGTPSELTITFDKAFPFTQQANAYETQPKFVLFAGLLFQPLDRNLLASYRFGSPRIAYLFDNYVSKEIYKDHPELVILSAILPDPINTYLTEFREGVVDEVNGRKIRNLGDLADSLAQKTDFYVIKFLGTGRPLVLDRVAVEGARDRIKSRYNVLAEQNLEATPAS
jgi:hypothetical protein